MLLLFLTQELLNACSPSLLNRYKEVGTDRCTQLRTIDREEEVGTDRCIQQHRTVDREIVG